MIASLFFYLFSAILLGSAAAVVTSRNPGARGVVPDPGLLQRGGALFVLAGAEFLALILVIVYVGAVAVLFLFVVMMLDVDFVQLREGFQKYAPVGAAVGVVLFGELAAVLFGWQIAPGAHRHCACPRRPDDVDNTRALGQVIYTDYMLLFQLSGLILLVAMIGAIVLDAPPARPARKPSGHHAPAGTHGERDAGNASACARAPASAELGVYRRKPEPVAANGHAVITATTRIILRGSTDMPEGALAIGLGHYLTVGAVLLVIGVFGIFLNRKNVIIILMSIELILLAVNVNLVAFSSALNDMAGQVLALFVLTVAAAEAAIGLGNRRGLFPQPWLDRGRGRESDEGLTMIFGDRRLRPIAGRDPGWPAGARAG